jgi:hypothetical protein
LKQEGTDWHFLPAKASHFAGVHERMIRIARSCLRHALGDQALTDESFQTLVTEVEFMMNSRPLTPFSSDPDDLRPLVPNDLLLQKAPEGLPPDVFPEGPVKLQRRWKQTQQIVDRFWRRFRQEYLSQLTLRSKWLVSRRSLRVGDLVVVHEEDLKRNLWKLGRVSKVFPSADGRVRSVQVKTATSELVRPIVKVALLEAAED